MILASLMLAATVGAGAPALAQPAGTAPHPTDTLPPISFACPMHPEVIDGVEGTCPICEMDLVATRTELAYTCPVHGVIHAHEVGICPIDGRTLQPVTLELTWTCPDHPAVAATGPGACPIGEHRELAIAWKARAHGDHNPKHGGLFFMAPDNWHHLEGSYPEPGIFRVHVYDDFTQPMNVAAFSGRVVTDEVFDAATRTTNELASFPLRSMAGGEYLEARLDALDVPVTLVAKVAFEPNGSEFRFDFTFSSVTVEPSGAQVFTSGVTGSTIAIPEGADDVVVELAVRQLRLRQLIHTGALDEIYVPALEAKDLALNLETKLATLTVDRRRVVVFAIRRLVLASWRLDGFGDLGDRQAVEAAFGDFSTAVADIQGAYGMR